MIAVNLPRCTDAILPMVDQLRVPKALDMIQNLVDSKTTQRAQLEPQVRGDTYMRMHTLHQHDWYAYHCENYIHMTKKCLQEPTPCNK